MLVEVVLCIKHRVAKKLEGRSVDGIGAALCRHIDLIHIMTELSRCDASFYFEFLKRVERREKDVGIKVWISIFKAVKSVMVVHDAVAANGQGKLAPSTSLPLNRDLRHCGG